MLASDVARSAAVGTVISLRSEKGRGHHTTARSLTLPPGAVPGLEALLSAWERMRGAVAGTDSYWSFPGEAHFPSSQVDSWLQEILRHLGESPPDGHTWSGHSLRKGAASGSNAIDVSLTKICWCGGWSIQSRAVHDYIDPTCPATPACWLFFGWLRTVAPPPAEAAAFG